MDKSSIKIPPSFPSWTRVSAVSTRGGSGKTTSIILEGLYLHSLQIPTILIDTDRDSALTNIMLPSGRLRPRIGQDHSIRPSLYDILDTFRSGGDCSGKFMEALITCDAFPDDKSLLIIPSDYRMAAIDHDENLAKAFLDGLDYLEDRSVDALGRRIVLIDPSNHDRAITTVLGSLSGRKTGGACVAFPTQRYATQATMATRRAVIDMKVRDLGLLPTKWKRRGKQYLEIIKSTRSRGLTVLVGFHHSDILMRPSHDWAVSGTFPSTFLYGANDLARAIGLPIPPEINPDEEAK